MTGSGLDVRDLTDGCPRTQAAVAYAQQAHAGQRRRADGSPFILHPLEVAILLEAELQRLCAVAVHVGR